MHEWEFEDKPMMVCSAIDSKRVAEIASGQVVMWIFVNQARSSLALA